MQSIEVIHWRGFMFGKVGRPGFAVTGSGGSVARPIRKTVSSKLLIFAGEMSTIKGFKRLNQFCTVLISDVSRRVFLGKCGVDDSLSSGSCLKHCESQVWLANLEIWESVGRKHSSFTSWIHWIIAFFWRTWGALKVAERARALFTCCNWSREDVLISHFSATMFDTFMIGISRGLIDAPMSCTGTLRHGGVCILEKWKWLNLARRVF